ncbi:hypothetical protein EV121DRAFT_214545 [Schizophyllum commune]
MAGASLLSRCPLPTPSTPTPRTRACSATSSAPRTFARTGPSRTPSPRASLATCFCTPSHPRAASASRRTCRTAARWTRGYTGSACCLSSTLCTIVSRRVRAARYSQRRMGADRRAVRSKAIATSESDTSAPTRKVKLDDYIEACKGPDNVQYKAKVRQRIPQ